ncbi:hypothetical protein GDO78_007463 [Eleutherodactylus coqui]|uniref:Gypsy retrotransposon integrase-like protein 1 n=1 Tax=Eleutherodactylus coqui TaxID=57060 RepID=A0A8J6KCA6_ELECQ|nr:hypothetical protein GDO78_007463 [Eleutherodactylus coqui]
MEPLQLAEEVVESSPNKLEDIYRLLAEGSFPASFCSSKKKNLKRYARKFILEGGCLYYVGPKNEEKREVVVDPERRHHIFLESHLTESGHHLGQKKTVNRIQSRYYWLGVVKDVIDWIKVCETCQNADYHKYPSKKCKPVKADTPWEILTMTLYGPFPTTSQLNTYILIVTDVFTKWTEAVPIPTNDALCIAKALSSIYYRFGAAKNIYFNQTWDFCEEISRLLCERWNISLTLTAADTTDHTGVNEQTYEDLKCSIKRVVNDNQDNWDERLDPVLFQFRTLVNPVTKYTPFFLMFNRNVQVSSMSEAVEESNDLEVVCPRNIDLAQHTSGVQLQRTAVLANISAVDIQQRKTAEKSRRSAVPITFQAQDNVFDSVADQTMKKFKHNHIVSFKFETVLSPEDNTEKDS